MYLVLSQVEHQTIECHRKNIYIVYLFGLSVVSLIILLQTWQTSPGLPWPPIPPRQLSPGRPPLAHLPSHISTDLP